MALNLKPASTYQKVPSELDNSRVVVTPRLQIPEDPDTTSQIVTPLNSSQLMSGSPIREFILVAGKDGVGKSCSIASLSLYVSTILNPDAKFYVIDTENKFRTALRGLGETIPDNIIYYKTDTMNQVTWAVNDILTRHSPGDWCAVESMSRVWERAQDLGYMAVSGYSKIEYMERRATMEGKKAPATPSPDQLWSVTKGAHDSAFLDRLTQSDDLNVVLSTTLSKPPKPDAFMKENQDRRALRAELGIDSGIEGAPRLPYYVETLCMLEVKNGRVSCRILRDNLSSLEDPRIEFAVDDRKSWAMNFWENCRG